MTAVTPPVITTTNLTKSYGRHQALFGLDMEVHEGEIFGFLGPNGSGKTTTIRILLDLIRRSDGDARVFGLDTRADGMEIRRRVGYLPGELTIASRRPARELLTYLGNLRGGVARHRISALAERLDLDLSRPIRGLSKGNKQKVGLVQAFMHDPDLLILDEPTSGLDPLLQQEFLAMVRNARKEGRTVFMSSHVLSEVQDVADRAAIIRAGRIVALEDIDALRERMVREFSIRFAERVRAEEFTGIDNIRELHIEGDSVRCTVDGSPDDLIKAAARYTVLTLDSHEPDLEELFFHHYDDAYGTAYAKGAERHAAA